MTAFAVPGFYNPRTISRASAVRSLPGTSRSRNFSAAVTGAAKGSVRSFGHSRIRPALFTRRCVVTSKGPESDYSKARDDAARMSFVNRLLASRSITLSFIVICSMLYLVAICLVGLAVSRVSMEGHQRVVLLGLGVLLPDFRHVLKSYSEAVQQLQRYKPGFKGFRFAARPTAKEMREDPLQEQYGDVPPEPYSWRKQPELAWLSGAMRQIQEKIESNTSKIDKLLADFSRDFTRPIVETSTQIKQLTTGTDLTLRKNVIAAAVSIFLSLAGYFVSAAGETSIGGVAIMLGSLVPNAVLAPRHHEMLTLIQDIRIAISLVGTLACAVSVFFPVCASYCLLLCCLSLVVTRLPVDWMLNW